jgi:protein O-GlcNAc transferase
MHMSALAELRRCHGGCNHLRISSAIDQHHDADMTFADFASATEQRRTKVLFLVEMKYQFQLTTRHEALNRAKAALLRGDAVEAGKSCAALLQNDPGDFEAIHVSGRATAALGNWVEAASTFRRALAFRPGYVPALVDLGLAQALAGDIREAYAVLEQARAIDQRPAELHFGLGLCRMESGDLVGAADAFHACLARNPRFADAHNNLGVVHDRLGQLQQAVEHFRRAIVIRADFEKARMNLADALLRVGNASEAAAVFQSAVALRPQDARLHADLGAARLAAGDFVGAAEALEHAIALDARLPGALTNLGEALRNLQQGQAATAAFERALAISPELAEAHLGLGKLAASNGNPAEASARLLRAVQLRPGDARLALAAAATLESLGREREALRVVTDFCNAFPGNADVHDSAGKLQLQLGHAEAALLNFDRALAVQAARTDTLKSRGEALEALGRHAQAIDSIEAALALQPGHTGTIASLASCAIRVCDWDRVDQAVARLREVRLGIDALHPFLLLSTDIPPTEQTLSLQRRGERLCRSTIANRPARYFHERLRVAYLSPDFREHPVAYSLAGVIERHDRTRFATMAIALTAPGTTEMALRLRSSFEQFIDASAMSDPDVVELMRQHEIDIAIDLAGHTAGARPGIFAHRPSRLQISYLGFPASTGLKCMDYIIADAIVLPVVDEPLYSERVLRVPNCYLPFDCTRQEIPASLRRADVGLPPDAFVFCAFNNAYKITRRMFKLWMGLLRQVPEAVLWLRSMGEPAALNLRSAAQACGIAPERLLFAPYLQNLKEHVARLQLADVFLDTLPYNAHSSAAEALWAGLPVVTCRGDTFAGRVGASLLTAAALPELITEDLAGYEALALELAHSPSALKDLRAHLREHRSSAPLFDTARYTRDLERLLLAAHEAVR